MSYTNITNSIFTSKFKLRNALNFIEKAKDPDYNLYLFASRILPWEHNQNEMFWVEYVDVDGEVVAVAKDNIQQTHYEPWRDMIYAKIIADSDVQHCIPRYNWTPNTVYEMYDDTVSDLDTKKFFVITDDEATNPVYSVYKCLYNNNGKESTEKPSGEDTDSPIYMSDGYIWKFMFSLSTTEVNNFLTDTYIPVKQILTNDGSKQYETQENAVDGSVPVIMVTLPGFDYDTHYGTVQLGSNSSVIVLEKPSTSASPQPSDSPDRYVGSQIYIEGGTGVGQKSSIVAYSGANEYQITIDPPFDTPPDTTSEYIITPTVTINNTDGGTGLSAVCVMDSSGNSVESIAVIDSGSGYKRNYNYDGSDVVSISANGGSDAAARLIISPPGGHGSNAIAELFAYNVLVKSEFSGNEGGELTTENDYRQFGLLENPIEYGGTEKYSDATAQLTYSLVVSEPIPSPKVFEVDEIVKNSTDTANGIIVDYDSSASNILKVCRTSGSFEVGDVITQSGGDGPVTATISEIINPDIEPFTGDIIFLANRESISRADEQIEEFHLIFTL